MNAKSFFNSLQEFGGWSVSNTEKMFPRKKDREAISKIKVVEREAENGDQFLCMVFFLVGGKQKSHYLSNQSSLKDGDIVDPASVELLTLSRDDDDDIYRLDGKKLESDEDNDGDDE